MRFNPNKLLAHLSKSVQHLADERPRLPLDLKIGIPLQLLKLDRKLFSRKTLQVNFIEHLSRWVLAANPDSGHETHFALFAICCKLGRRTDAFNLYNDVINKIDTKKSEITCHPKRPRSLPSTVPHSPSPVDNPKIAGYDKITTGTLYKYRYILSKIPECPFPVDKEAYLLTPSPCTNNSIEMLMDVFQGLRLHQPATELFNSCLQGKHTRASLYLIHSLLYTLFASHQINTILSLYQSLFYIRPVYNSETIRHFNAPTPNKFTMVIIVDGLVKMGLAEQAYDLIYNHPRFLQFAIKSCGSAPRPEMGLFETLQKGFGDLLVNPAPYKFRLERPEMEAICVNDFTSSILYAAGYTHLSLANTAVGVTEQIKNYLRNDQVETARALFDRYIATLHDDFIPYEIMIKYYLDTQDIHSANEILNLFTARKSIFASPCIVTLLIQQSIRMDDLRRTLELFNTALKEQVVTEVMIRKMVMEFVKAEEWEKGSKFIEYCQETGIRIGYRAYDYWCVSLIIYGFIGEAMKVFHTCITTCSPDQEFFEVILSALITSHCTEEANVVYEEFLRRFPVMKQVDYVGFLKELVTFPRFRERRTGLI